MSILEHLAEEYDLKKMKTLCNVEDCKKIPSKDVLFFEIDFKTMGQKDLASVYFCSNHFNSKLQDLLKKLNKLSEKGKLIEMRISDTNIITK